MQKNKGFTLIELLVVIAIIGILASVVLASLSSARVKGADSSVKANLNSIRAEAEIYYLDKGDYNGLCAHVLTMREAAVNAGTLTEERCFDTQLTIWAAWVQLKSDKTKAWCVDSVGNSQQITKPSYSDNINTCSD